MSKESKFAMQDQATGLEPVKLAAFARWSEQVRATESQHKRLQPLLKLPRTGRPTHRWTSRPTDRPTDPQIHRLTDRPIDRDRDRQVCNIGAALQILQNNTRAPQNLELAAEMNALVALDGDGGETMRIKRVRGD